MVACFCLTNCNRAFTYPLLEKRLTGNFDPEVCFQNSQTFVYKQRAASLCTFFGVGKSYSSP